MLLSCFSNDLCETIVYVRLSDFMSISYKICQRSKYKLKNIFKLWKSIIKMKNLIILMWYFLLIKKVLFLVQNPCQVFKSL